MGKSMLAKVIDLKKYEGITKLPKKSLCCLIELMETETSVFILTSYLAINLNKKLKTADIRQLFPNKKSKILEVATSNKPSRMNKKLLCTPRPSIIKNPIVDCILDFNLRKRIHTGKGARSIRVCSVEGNWSLIEIWNYNRYELDFSKSNNDCLTILENKTQKFLIRKKLEFLNQDFEGENGIGQFFREFCRLARSGDFVVNDIGQFYFYFKCQTTHFMSSISFTLRPSISHLRNHQIYKRKVVYNNQNLEEFLAKIQGFDIKDLERVGFVISILEESYFFRQDGKELLLLIFKGEKNGKKDLSSNTKPKPFLYLLIQVAGPKNAYGYLDLTLVKMSPVYEEKFQVRLMNRVSTSKESKHRIFLKIVGVEICFPDFETLADIGYFDDDFELVYVYKAVCPNCKLFVYGNKCELFFIEEEKLELNCLEGDLDEEEEC